MRGSFTSLSINHDVAPMSTAAWICFHCRTAVRRDTLHRSAVPCPTCGKPCSYLGYKIPVPPKRKRRDWLRLREQLVHERTERDLCAEQRKVRHRHDLEREIARLEALPPNTSRARSIHVLRKRLEDTDLQ